MVYDSANTRDFRVGVIVLRFISGLVLSIGLDLWFIVSRCLVWCLVFCEFVWCFGLVLVSMLPGVLVFFSFICAFCISFLGFSVCGGCGVRSVWFRLV